MDSSASRMGFTVNQALLMIVMILAIIILNFTLASVFFYRSYRRRMTRISVRRNQGPGPRCNCSEIKCLVSNFSDINQTEINGE